MKKVILSISGMTCSGCSSGLEKYLNKQKGIINANVNLVMANASIQYDENVVNLKKIEQYVKEAGFKSLGVFNEKSIEEKSKSKKLTFIIFAILAIVMMYISMGHMINAPIPEFLNIQTNPINYTISLFILTIAFMIYGFDIIKSGFKNAVHKTPNMDTLVSIGVLSSFSYSIYSMFMIIKENNQYVHNLYFESAAIVIFFIKLGRYIDKISKNKTKEAIQSLVKITPNNAVVKTDGIEKTVTIDEIKKGDIIVCKPGEKIAVDGKIITGKAHLDESFITGESKPSNKTIGDTVIAGSINYDGYIEYTAEKIGKESTISEIVRLVVEATNTKAPIAKVADKISGIFVPTVIVIAIITFIAYLILGETIGSALTTFVTILVVACPCSLGLATPLAIIVSEGLCAKNGILVKKSEILENAQKVDTVVFDKTGTLTYGNLKISQVINYSNMEEKEIIQLVGSLENKSSHPIAKAFVNYLEENKIDVLEVDNFQNVSGCGIVGIVAGSEIMAGNAKMIFENGNCGNWDGSKFQKDEQKLAESGNSIVYVIKDKEIIALIGVNDIIRENTKHVIEILNKRNIQTIMLTGDHKETAEKIAENIGITKVIANVLPSEKAEIIKKLKQENKNVMMCGDGINDSPALANADIGVSVNSGTDIAMDSSDVILTKNDLYSIVNLINISKKTIRNIKQNLFWAFFYNILMIPIAMGILIPWRNID